LAATRYAGEEEMSIRVDKTHKLGLERLLIKFLGEMSSLGFDECTAAKLTLDYVIEKQRKSYKLEKHRMDADIEVRESARDGA
tara:strand:- start:364 stop:612 length:249 start_codon:yes stop_codon:yes gene_type:complete